MVHGSPWLCDCPGIGTIGAGVMSKPQDLGDGWQAGFLF